MRIIIECWLKREPFDSDSMEVLSNSKWEVVVNRLQQKKLLEKEVQIWTFFLTMQVPLNCTVAPSSESRRLPKRPQSVPSGRASNCVFLTCPWQEVDKYPTNTNTRPIKAPPAAAAAVPNTDNPPLVPFGTGCITYISCAPWFIQTSPTIQDSKDFIEKRSVSELQDTLKAPLYTREVERSKNGTFSLAERGLSRMLVHSNPLSTWELEMLRWHLNGSHVERPRQALGQNSKLPP